MAFEDEYTLQVDIFIHPHKKTPASNRGFVIRERVMVPSVVSTLVTLQLDITAETFNPDFSATTGHILQMTARTVFCMIN